MLERLSANVRLLGILRYILTPSTLLYTKLERDKCLITSKDRQEWQALSLRLRLTLLTAFVGTRLVATLRTNFRM